MTFNVGDRVRDIGPEDWDSHGQTGTVTEVSVRPFPVRVAYDGDDKGYGLYKAHEIELIPAVAAPTVERKTEVKTTISITFPGDDEPYELTEQEAYALLRDLDRVL